MKNISDNALKIISKMQQNELNESYIYRAISKFVKGDENKKTLLRLADEEEKHYNIWKHYTGKELKPNKFKIAKYKWMARILGFTFAVKLMEKGEEIAQKEYELLAEEVEESKKIQDESSSRNGRLFSKWRLLLFCINIKK